MKAGERGGLKKKEGRAMNVGSGCGRMGESHEGLYHRQRALLEDAIGAGRSAFGALSGCLNPPCYCGLTSQAVDC